ncbi:MAG TPA: hypothetical protein VG929_00175 [Actinomycetota bacterium]|nr:hypothetical protein [Actinomycetota bacterium]
MNRSHTVWGPFAAVAMVVALMAVALAGPAGARERTSPPLSDHAYDTAEEHVHTDGIGLARLDRPVAGGDLGPSFTWSSGDYDGKVFTTDAPDMTVQVGLPTVHVVYLYPSDAPSRFATYAGFFQGASRSASAALAHSVGRQIRYDERLGADGVTRYLDISVVKSKNSTKRLQSSNAWSTIKSEIDSLFKNPNKKYLVFVDAFSTTACGQSQLLYDTQRTSTNVSEGRTVSTVYRVKRDSTVADGGWCGRGTVLHELTHAMGALQTAAPNFSGGHCNDYGNDRMCTASDVKIPYDPTMPIVYDYGNDDYWDPAADPASGSDAKLGWWTVNLSRFLCATSGCDAPNANPGY